MKTYATAAVAAALIISCTSSQDRRAHVVTETSSLSTATQCTLVTAWEKVSIGSELTPDEGAALQSWYSIWEASPASSSARSTLAAAHTEVDALGITYQSLEDRYAELSQFGTPAWDALEAEVEAVFATLPEGNCGGGGTGSGGGSGSGSGGDPGPGDDPGTGGGSGSGSGSDPGTGGTDPGTGSGSGGGVGSGSGNAADSFVAQQARPPARRFSVRGGGFLLWLPGVLMCTSSYHEERDYARMQCNRERFPWDASCSEAFDVLNAGICGTTFGLYYGYDFTSYLSCCQGMPPNGW